jgi:hypothetical protein
MTNTQKTSEGFGLTQREPSRTPLRKRMAIGAASVLATGALAGAGLTVGVSAASAAPAHATSSASGSSGSSSTTHEYSHIESLVRQVRAALFHGSIDGGKAQAVAKKIVADKTVFSQLPVALQSDLKKLASATNGERTSVAKTIKSTALSGGYGELFARGATVLQATQAYPISQSLVREIAGDVSSAHGIGDAGTQIAATISDHDALFSQLPKQLQQDVTDLKNAPASERVSDVQRIEQTAFDGGYGQKLQTLAKQLAAGAARSTSSNSSAD